MGNKLWYVAMTIVLVVVVLFVDGLDGTNNILDAITYGK